jgi:hypothetical protein
MWRDLKKNYKWVLKGAGLMFGMIAILKILIFFGLKDIFVPVMIILVPIIMLIYWYSMSYDNEQKKIVKTLKGDK